MPKSKNYKKYFHVIGLLLFVYLVYKIDLGRAYESISNFNFYWLFFYAFAFSSMVMLKAQRWKLLLSDQSINYSYGKAFSVSVTSNFLGALTPGRVGELIKLEYIRNDNYPLPKGVVNIFVDRAFDLVMLGIFSLLSMFYFIDLFYNEMIWILAVLLVLAAIGTLIFYLRSGIRKTVLMLLKKIVPESKYNAIESNWSEIRKEFGLIGMKTLLKMSAVSLLIYALTFVMTYIVALGFGMYISFIYLSFCMALASMISLLPVSIGGIGTREAVFIVLLGNIAVPRESALLIAFFDSTILGNFFSAAFAFIKSVLMKTGILEKES